MLGIYNLRSGKKKSKIDIDLLKEMYLNRDMTMSEIADELGICLATVQQHLKNAGIEKDKRAIHETYNRTMLDRYGDTAPIRVDSINEKIKATNRQRYGVDTPLESENIRSKTCETKNARHDDSAAEDSGKSNMNAERFIDVLTYDFLTEYFITRNMRRSEIAEMVGCSDATVKKMLRKFGIKKDKKRIMELQEQTCFERYGAKSNMSTSEFREKSHETSLRKYGCDHPSQSESVKSKLRETSLQKYGKENPAQAEEIRAKISLAQSDEDRAKAAQMKRKKFYQEKYGENVTHQSLVHVEHLSEWNNFESWAQLAYEANGNIPIEKTSASDYFNVTYGTLSAKVRETHTGELFTSKTSEPEYKWKKWLEDIGLKTQIHNRSILKQLEIDILIPDFNIGIEIDPTASHNSDVCVFAPETGSPKAVDYHQRKSLMAESAEYNLIHIFNWSDELGMRQQIKKLCRMTDICDVINPEYSISENKAVIDISDLKPGEKWIDIENTIKNICKSVPECSEIAIIEDFSYGSAPEMSFVDEIGIRKSVEYLLPTCWYSNAFNMKDSNRYHSIDEIPAENRKYYKRIFDAGKKITTLYMS